MDKKYYTQVREEAKRQRIVDLQGEISSKKREIQQMEQVVEHLKGEKEDGSNN